MKINVLRRANQMILVCVEVFFYVTACLIPSEKADDLANTIIQVVTPIRRSNSILVRVDKAPGFLKLINSSQSILYDVGISLQMGNDENKNSNCIVNKAIDELETKLRKSLIQVIRSLSHILPNVSYS